MLPRCARVELVGRDWLQQLCLVNTDACKNTQETLFYFILFYFALNVRTAHRSDSGPVLRGRQTGQLPRGPHN